MSGARQRLLDLREKTRAELKLQCEAVAEAGSCQRTADENDRLQAMADQSTGAGLALVAHGQLVNIDLALRREREGTYGICQDCDVPIPQKRLDAQPFALRCVGCEERLEASA